MAKSFTLLALLALLTMSVVQAVDVYCFCHNWLQQVMKTETRQCLGLGTVPQFKHINSKGVLCILVGLRRHGEITGISAVRTLQSLPPG
ncbi:MAG: hypothetical protein JOS17DRAFT_748984 [Linnemannia elongata]|nr:MAG: hypothetical protein JOS17DRAFT_748984 [Linnemannia elongata]